MSADGTLVWANASFKCFAPIELVLEPEEYKERLRSKDGKSQEDEPDDPGL